MQETKDKNVESVLYSKDKLTINITVYDLYAENIRGQVQ